MSKYAGASSCAGNTQKGRLKDSIEYLMLRCGYQGQ